MNTCSIFVWPLPSDIINVTLRHLDPRVTYLRVSLVLQVEQAKQLTHQALLRADTTEKTKNKTLSRDVVATHRHMAEDEHIR